MAEAPSETLRLHCAAMCSNYVAVTSYDRLLNYFGVQRARDEPPVDVWPTGLAPFIRLRQGENGPQRVVEDGHFGLVPDFQRELVAGRRTYNARSETVAVKPSFRDAWNRGQRCIVPAEHIYEPSYESGRAVRWQINRPNLEPMGIAGLWSEWTDPDGIKRLTFTMLTVNADGHPVMSRFHKPEDEKRMVVILAKEEYDAWLTCPVAQAPGFFRPWIGPLEASAKPLPSRVMKPSKPATDDRGLFDDGALF